MAGLRKRFTSDRRGVNSASWTDDADWQKGAPENVEIANGSIIPTQAQLIGEAYGGQVFVTGDWNTGKKPETATNLIDGNKDTGVTDGRIYDNHDTGARAEILVQYDDPINWSAISYELRINHSGDRGWTKYRHRLEVGDGNEWKEVDSWSGDHYSDIDVLETQDLPLDNVNQVALKSYVNGGNLDWEEITAKIQYFNFLLVE